MANADEGLETVLAFLTELDIKDLVFLLSKSLNRKQFDEIQTANDLLKAVQTWYGLDAVPSVIYSALIAANQPVLAACVANVRPEALRPASGQQQGVPDKLRQLMFNVAVQFPDSEAPHLQRQLGLSPSPVPRDSLDLMTTLLENRLVTESRITLLLQLSSVCPSVEPLCKLYSYENAGVVSGSLDVGGGVVNGFGGLRRTRSSDLPPRALVGTHIMNNPVCVILNVNSVPGREVRTGSHRDVHRVTELFQKFRYHVFPWPDLTREDFEKNVRSLKQSSNIFDGLVFFVMSHGHDDFVEMADGSRLHCKKEIVAPFLDGCFHEKPKVFIFQCCRGQHVQRYVSFDGPSEEQPQMEVRYQDNSELFIFHSTFEGFAAVREDEGSWFIRTLCDCLDVPERIELNKLRMIVIDALKQRWSQVDGNLITQTPAGETNTMSKNVFLKPL